MSWLTKELLPGIRAGEKLCGGCSLSPHLDPGDAASPGMLLTSPAFASSCPHPAQFAQTLPPSFATAFIYKSFQCCVRGNFRVGKRKSTELGELWEPSSLWIISRLKYLCEVWRFFFFPWAGSCPVKGFKLRPKSSWIQRSRKGILVHGKILWIFSQNVLICKFMH